MAEGRYYVNVSVLGLYSGEEIIIDPDDWPAWLFEKQYVRPIENLQGDQATARIGPDVESDVQPPARNFRAGDALSPVFVEEFTEVHRTGVDVWSASLECAPLSTAPDTIRSLGPDPYIPPPQLPRISLRRPDTSFDERAYGW